MKASVSVALAVALLAALVILALGVGPSGVDLSHAFAMLRGAELEPWERAVLIDVRLPRVLVALASGAALAVSGAALQGLFRNPLADPGVLGVSSGATLGAVSALYLGGNVLPELAVPIASLGGALVATFLVYRLATIGGRGGTLSLLLAGIAVSSAAGALASFVLAISLAEWELGRQLLSWLMGGLEGRGFSHLAVVVPPTLAALALLMSRARELDAMALGEQSAASIGVDVASLRRVVLALTCVATGASVAVSGSIAFLGLVAPHLVRLALGPGHARLLPASAWLGGAALVAADTLTRALSREVDLRPGVLTALVGAPFFVWLLIRQRRAEAA